MKEDYPQLRAIDVEMKFAAGSEKMAMPNAKQFSWLFFYFFLCFSEYFLIFKPSFDLMISALRFLDF